MTKRVRRHAQEFQTHRLWAAIATQPLDWWMPMFLRESPPWLAYVKFLCLTWQQITGVVIRWHNHLAVKRVKAVMEVRRRQFAAQQVRADWLPERFLEEAWRRLRETERRYPYTRGAYAMPGGRYTQTLRGEIDMDTFLSGGNAAFAGPVPFVDVSAQAYTSLQQAVTAAAGGVAYFPPGYAPAANATITVGAGTTLHFRNTQITVTAALANGLFQCNANDIRIEGQYNIVGGGFATDIFAVNASPYATRFVHDASGRCNGLNTANSCIEGQFCTNILITGLLTSTTNRLVHLKAPNYYHVSGIQAGPYTAALAAATAPVHITDFGNTFPPTRGTAHDIIVNAGAQLTYGSMVVAQAQGGQTHGTGLAVSNILITNGLITGDGLDIVQIDQVTTSNVNTNGMGNGTDIAACTQVQGYGGTSLNCNLAGLQAGDSSVAFSTSLVTMNGYISIDCGFGSAGFNAAGIVLFAPGGQGLNVVTLVNCQSFKSAQAGMLYGLGAGGGTVPSNGTFSNVSVHGGFLLGNTGAFLDSTPAGPSVTFYNVFGTAANILGQFPNFQFAGHLVSTVVGIPATTNLGANVTSATFTGNDVRGTIAIVMSGALAANTRICTATFAVSYGGTAPKIMLVNQTSGAGITIVNFYVQAQSTGVSFDIASDQALGAGTYTISYFVLG